MSMMIFASVLASSLGGALLILVPVLAVLGLLGVGVQQVRLRRLRREHADALTSVRATAHSQGYTRGWQDCYISVDARLAVARNLQAEAKRHRLAAEAAETRLIHGHTMRRQPDLRLGLGEMLMVQPCIDPVEEVDEGDDGDTADHAAGVGRRRAARAGLGQWLDLGQHTTVTMTQAPQSPAVLAVASGGLCGGGGTGSGTGSSPSSCANASLDWQPGSCAA